MASQNTAYEQPHPSSDIELEWQFDVDDLAAAKRSLHDVAAETDLTITPSGDQRLVDHYLETSDWAFHRARYALRLRQDEMGTEACLKALNAETNGPQRRREINEALAEADRQALRVAAGPVGKRVRAVAGGRDLLPLFTLHTRRQTYELRSSANGRSSVLAEVALDETHIVANGKSTRAPMRRIEIELAGSHLLETIEPFAVAFGERRGVERAQASKFHAGLSAAALRPATGPDLGPTRIRRSASIGEVAYATMRQQLTAYLENEPAARLGECVEPLHQMRVAVRQLRTAMRVFEIFLPHDLLGLREELRSIARTLGTVRDLDVMIGWLQRQVDKLPSAGSGDPAASLGLVVERLEQRRTAARTRMLAALDSPRHQRIIEALCEHLRAGVVRGPAGDAKAVRVAPRLIRKRYKRLRRRADRLGADAPDKAHHSARIRAKHLRYTVAFFAPLFGRAARRVIKAATRAQDELGRRQDAAVRIERLRRIALGRKPLPASAVLAVGELMERERQTVSAITDEFPAIYRRLRRHWRRLDRALRS